MMLLRGFFPLPAASGYVTAKASEEARPFGGRGAVLCVCVRGVRVKTMVGKPDEAVAAAID